MLFAVSIFKSYEELRYYCGGRQTTATVLRVREEHHWKDRHHLGWRITFRFHNEKSNEQQQGHSIVDDLSAKQFSSRQKVAVEYYNESLIGSRLLGDTNKLWVYLLMGSLSFCAVSTALLTWHSKWEEEQLRNRKWWIR